MNEPDELPAPEDDTEAIVPDEAEAQDQEQADEEALDVDALKARAKRADELEDRLRRAEADFMNETKRLRRLAENDAKFAVEQVVVELIPLIDALHSAGTGLGDGEAAANMRQGLDLVGKQLLDVLKKHGVEPIDAEGETFDPNRHEAIYVRELEDVEPDSVIEVLRPGFSLHGRVVRPVEVGVAKAPAGEPAEPSDEGGGESEEGA